MLGSLGMADLLQVWFESEFCVLMLNYGARWLLSLLKTASIERATEKGWRGEFIWSSILKVAFFHGIEFNLWCFFSPAGTLMHWFLRFQSCGNWRTVWMTCFSRPGGIITCWSINKSSSELNRLGQFIPTEECLDSERAYVCCQSCDEFLFKYFNSRLSSHFFVCLTVWQP